MLTSYKIQNKNDNKHLNKSNVRVYNYVVERLWGSKGTYGRCSDSAPEHYKIISDQDAVLPVARVKVMYGLGTTLSLIRHM